MCQLRVVFSILLVLYIIEATLSQTKYCNKNLCKGKKHIACNNKGKFAKTCSRNVKIMPITPKLQSLIVDKHNALRNRIAKGGFRGYKPAVRMATMSWSSELAKLAEYNVKQCEMKHDKCRNTNKFRFAGQNIAQTTWSGQKKAVGSVALSQIQLWFAENQKCSMNIIKNFKKNSKCGHFTAMIQEKNINVGCAILRQTLNGRTMQLMACDYAYTNILNKPVYRNGPSGSKCRTGRNPQFKALCSTRENYKLNGVEF